jgi:hypothetical protein
MRTSKITPFLCWIVPVCLCLIVGYTLIFHTKELARELVFAFICFGTFMFLLFAVKPPKTHFSKLVWTILWVGVLIFICLKPIPHVLVCGISGVALKNWLIFTVAVAGLVYTLKEKE